MKKVSATIITLLFLIFSYPGQSEPDNREKSAMPTEGVIIKVNTSDSSFLIKHASRVIKFKAPKKLAAQYNNKTNAKVIIFYSRLKDGSLYINEIQSAD